MNAKQERFCLEYASSGNATKSAINAGYSEKTARQIGQRLLTKVDIKSRLQKLAEEMESQKIAQGKELHETLTNIIRMKTKEQVVVNEFQGEGFSQATIIEKNPDLKDVINAIDRLARMQGLYDNKIQLELQIPIFEDDLEE